MAKRRARYTGSIRKTKSGKYEARFRDERGKPMSRTFSKERDAAAFLRDRISESERVKTGLEKRIEDQRLFKEATKAWLDDRATKRSIKTDASLIRVHLDPVFGHLELREISGPKIDAFKVTREALGLAKTSINHHLVLIGSVLRHSVEKLWLRHDQIPAIRKYKILPQDFAYLKNNHEIECVLRAAQVDTYPSALPIMATLIYTGMRVGELCGLRWTDIDFKTRLITVQRSYTNKTTKGAETRYVPILDGLLPVLQRWRLRSNGELVFTSLAGTMLTKDSRIFDQGLERILLSSGLPPDYITVHDTRHTFASHWLMNGGDRFRLQRILGHKDPKTTERYAHLHPDAFGSDMDRIPDLSPPTDSAHVLSLRNFTQH